MTVFLCSMCFLFFGLTLLLSPLLILTILLSSAVLLTKVLKNFTASSWPGLFLMLLYAGGMLILFLFLVAMTPKSSSNTKGFMVLPLLVMVGMMFFKLPFSNTPEKMMSWFFTVDWQIIMLATTILSSLMFLVSSMLYNPKASMKSSLMKN